jgi:hypothetical protein
MSFKEYLKEALDDKLGILSKEFRKGTEGYVNPFEVGDEVARERDNLKGIVTKVRFLGRGKDRGYAYDIKTPSGEIIVSQLHTSGKGSFKLVSPSKSRGKKHSVLMPPKSVWK